MKQVEFQGNTYSVPEWTKFITADRDGRIEAWAKEPYNYDNYWYRDGKGDEHGEHQIIVPRGDIVCEAVN